MTPQELKDRLNKSYLDPLDYAFIRYTLFKLLNLWEAVIEWDDAEFENHQADFTAHEHEAYWRKETAVDRLLKAKRELESNLKEELPLLERIVGSTTPVDEVLKVMGFEDPKELRRLRELEDKAEPHPWHCLCDDCVDPRTGERKNGIPIE